MGSHETIVQVRMAETFQLYNLDLQARPNDSPGHIAENVMCSLNEHAGDGKTVKLPEIHLTELEVIGVILSMSQSEIDMLAQMQDKLVSESVRLKSVQNTRENRHWRHL